jgi:MSHA biogenesis protein MshO
MHRPPSTERRAARRQAALPQRVGESVRRQQGFTLIEAVMTIAITGIVIGVVSVFIVPATTAYFSSAARAQLSDQADTALRRIARDLAQALPNSARVSASGQSLELIPVSGAARYAVNTATALQFGVSPIPDFAIVGPPLKLSHASQQLAWFNLGAGTPDADAYTLANVRTSTTAAGNAGSMRSNSPSRTAATPAPSPAR